MKRRSFLGSLLGLLGAAPLVVKMEELPEKETSKNIIKAGTPKIIKNNEIIDYVGATGEFILSTPNKINVGSLVGWDENGKLRTASYTPNGPDNVIGVCIKGTDEHGYAHVMINSPPFPDKPVRGERKLGIMFDDYDSIPDYDASKSQALTHDGNTMRWVDIV